MVQREGIGAEPARESAAGEKGDGVCTWEAARCGYAVAVGRASSCGAAHLRSYAADAVQQF
ncbi:hypothetical protein DN618_17815 [Aeromonas caviae]|nr:hypothetical protein DN618_17815 [Aeromonas caviae]